MGKIFFTFDYLRHEITQIRGQHVVKTQQLEGTLVQGGVTWPDTMSGLSDPECSGPGYIVAVHDVYGARE